MEGSMKRTILTETGKLVADTLMLLFVMGVLTVAVAGFFG
jgi:hypothetical protein